MAFHSRRLPMIKTEATLLVDLMQQIDHYSCGVFFISVAFQYVSSLSEVVKRGIEEATLHMKEERTKIMREQVSFVLFV